MKKLIIIFILFLFQVAQSQNKQFTLQDTLRGSITPERAWWDLTYYHLDIKVDPDNKFISGTNTINYKVLSSNYCIANRSATTFTNNKSNTRW